MDQSQLQQEQSYNQAFEKIIGATAWGKFYGLMKGASQIGEGAIPHKVCISEDGREIKVFNSKLGKVVGSFIRPTHEDVAKYLSKKQYGKAIGSFFLPINHVDNIKEQRDTNCFVVTPNEVISRASQPIPQSLRTELQYRRVFGIEEDVFLIGAGTVTIISLLLLIKFSR